VLLNYESVEFFAIILRTISICAKGCVFWSYRIRETAFYAELP